MQQPQLPILPDCIFCGGVQSRPSTRKATDRRSTQPAGNYSTRHPRHPAWTIAQTSVQVGRDPLPIRAGRRHPLDESPDLICNILHPVSGGCVGEGEPSPFYFLAGMYELSLAVLGR